MQYDTAFSSRFEILEQVFKMKKKAVRLSFYPIYLIFKNEGSLSPIWKGADCQQFLPVAHIPPSSMEKAQTK